MFMEHNKNLRTSQAHDGRFLESWKDGTRTIFRAVDHTMSHRLFMIVADDGELDFGPNMTYPDKMEVFPHKKPPYSAQAVDKAVSKIAWRTLVRKVLPVALAG